jgi:hypothetical protein
VADVLTGRQLRVDQESVGTVFSSLTAAQGYAELVMEQLHAGVQSDTVGSMVARLQDALREHERRMRLACGLAGETENDPS